MAFTIIIIAALFLCFSWLIVLFTRKGKPALSFRQAALFLGAKITAGAAYGFIYGKFYNGDDTWKLNNDCWLQYQRLLNSPALFFADFFAGNPLNQDARMQINPASHFERLEYFIITKTMAPFNSISQGNYYVNIVFFNFIGFWGAYLLYKLLTENGSVNRQWISLLVFLFPPFLFWTSGIRTEGFLLVFTALSVYAFNRVVRAPGAGNIIVLLLSLFTVFVMRSSFFFVLAPCFAFWWISARVNTKPLLVFGIGFGLLLAAGLLFNGKTGRGFNPLQVLAAKQQEFLALHGNTRLALPAMDGSVAGLFGALPYAVANSFIKPLPWEARGVLQWMVVFENLFFWSLVIISLIKYPLAWRELIRQPFWVSLFFFGAFNYIIIGLIVPFPGAIVRYRIIPEIAILAIAVSCINNGKNYILEKYNIINFK